MKTVSYFGRIYKCLPIRYNRNKGNFRFPKGEVTMKNNRKPIFWRRGLALLLAVCLAAGYVPVPGYAEGCTHAHGEDCYEVTTQCVHSHDESCYTDPAIMEAGEEPDACAHACAEETGCVTKALNCAHVHDSACGEAAEEEPKEEPRPEPQPEGKEEPKEEPKPQEEPKEEPEAPQEPQVKTVTAWTRLDEEEALDPETGKLCLVASEEAPVFLDQIVEVLPQAIEATVDGEGETLPVAAWTCGEYPEDGAYEGSFVLEAELPEGYALGDGVEALHVAVEFGGAVTLGENAVGVSLDGSWTRYATFDEAMMAVVTEGLSARSVEVKLYENSTMAGTYIIYNGMTLDLNGNRLERTSMAAGFSVGGGTLILKDSSQSGGGSSNVKFQTTGGRIQVDSGNWVVITARNGNVTVGGGWVNQITAYDTVTLKGGKIDYLAVDKASVISLSYGTFEGIRGINQKVLAADLLAPGYAFRWDHDQKLQRYKDLPTLDDNTAIGNTTVVQCQSHVFETGNPNCIYCNTPCTHSTVNQTTGMCETCGAAQYDAVVVTNPGTEQEQVTLYEKVSEAFAAADSIDSLTEIRLLRNVTPEDIPLMFPHETNLKGNGFTFCGGVMTKIDSSGSIENITLMKQSGQRISTQIEYGRVKLGPQCSIQGLQLGHVKTYDVVKDGFALYTDAQHTECADAATSLFTGTLYTGPHTHAYSEKNGSCDCGKTAEAKVTSGGKTTVYESVRDAISAANAGGGVVTVFENLFFPQIDRITGSMTIDLNGFTWYTRQSDRLFTVAGRDGTQAIITNGTVYGAGGAYACGAIYLQSGSLVIEGTAGLDGYTNPAITVTGGSLTLKAGAVLLHGLKAQSGHTIGEYLAPNTAYAVYDKATGKAAEPLTLVQGDVEETEENLVIVAHTHRFDANGKCQDCGYVCSHANVDMTTGKCAACSKQLYQAKIGTKGYATLNAALTAAQETENSTVTVLCDIDVPGTVCYRLAKGTVTLDLNGHKLADTERTDGSLFVIDAADFTIKGTTAGSAIQDQRIFAIKLLSGNLAIHGGSFGRIDWVGGRLTITDGEFEFLSYSRNPTATISGGTFQIITVDDPFAPSVWHTLKSGYAFFDVDSKKVVDASGQKLENVYVSTHTHTKRQGYKTCACGYTFPYATVTKAPEPLKLTYTGQTQTLVTQGTAEGGEMLYSLEKDGYYGKTVPFGIVKTYTVYYMVRGDSGHLDTEPESVTVTIKPTKRLLDLTGLNLAGDITIDGVDYPIEASNDTLYVTIPETGDLFTYYGYKNIWASNEHSNYPTSMSVYAIERTPTGSTAREITDLQDLLTYAGCSIRISGKQGIRMITALDEATKKALTGKGLAGYTLEEYGTVVSWTDALGNGSFLRLGESYARSNYAYRKGEADPVFARKNGIIQYTNVLVLENLTEADYDKDLTLRAYIRLRNTEPGETVTLYGGTVTRSIYYVARQNADTYKSGTAGYKFVHKIIEAVENP